MSNQTAAAIAAIVNAVDWERKGFDLQTIIEAVNQKQLGEPLTQWLANRGWDITGAIVFLRRLFKETQIVVGGTSGAETFTSSGIFTGGVYGLTVSIGDSKPILSTNVAIYEMVENGTFAEIFGSLGEIRCRWKESQVVQFCRDHRSKLRTGGYGTFFELEGGFVASVCFDDGGRLKVYVSGFSDGSVWNAEYQHRLVSPQQ